MAHLIPAARTACATLAATGRRLSRDALADQMRTAGHGVSSARATLLLKILKAEDTTRIDPTPTYGDGDRTGEPARADQRGEKHLAAPPRPRTTTTSSSACNADGSGLRLALIHRPQLTGP